MTENATCEHGTPIDHWCDECDGAFDDSDKCQVCGGDGYIMACDGDGSDWGEDTYSGPMNATIKCRHCNGNGYVS